MSFILDALKKSEAERLRQDTPGFADVPGSTREKPAHPWIWIVAILAVINVSALAYILLKPEANSDTVADVAAAAPALTGAPAIVAPATKPAATSSLSEIVGQSRPAAAPAAVSTDPVTRAVIDIATRKADPAPPVARYSPPQVSESYATFNDLRAQGALQLPDMHLDIHVYSSEPEDRFVFVNMSKYRERATLDEGPVVREITPDGVILDYGGTSFLLPRE